MSIRVDSEERPLISPSEIDSINGHCYSTASNKAAHDESQDSSADSGVVQPKSKWVLEPAVLLFCLGLMALSAVLPQYLYYRVSQQHNATANVTRAFVCNASTDLNSSESKLTQKIQEEASRWSLYRSLGSSGAALLVIPALASSSDFLGRKLPILLPAVGCLLDAAICLAVVILRLPLTALVAASFFSGLSGGFGVFLAGVFAYLADTTTRSSRAVRIAIVEATFAVGMIVMEMGMGWWMRLSGYTAPLLFSCSSLLLTVLYLLLLLPEVRPKATRADVSLWRSALRPFANIASLFRISARTTASLLLLLLALLLMCTAFMGSMTVASLFQMNLPFCLDSVAIGYLSAVKTLAGQLGTFFGLVFLRKWLGAHSLSLLGLASAAASYALTGFASSQLELFAAAGAAVLALLPIPLLRAHMSQLLPGDRQGALFSCVAVLEVGGNFIGAGAFVSIYKASLATWPGVVFIFCVALAAGAFALIAASACVESSASADRCPELLDSTTQS